jgi:hypothetical protein
MVTSRATGDDLIEDQDTPSADITAAELTSDVMAPPRQPARKPAAVKPAKDAPASGKPDAAVQDAPARDAKANGGSATKEAARPAPVDATVIDRIPALPADGIGSARGAKPKEPEEAPPPSVPSALRDPVISSSAEAAAKPSDDAPATSSPAGSSVSGSSVSGSSGAGTASSGTSSSAAAAETSSMPPAAFAWEMPDPPPNSPSSPARAFLRSGLTAKNPAPASAKTASAAPAAKPATREAPARGAAPSRSAPSGSAPSGSAQGDSTRSSPVTLGPPRSGPAKSGAGQKAKQKAQSKRGARQAHLTVARVEPWSVMKFSFVVSLVAFVILFVAVSILYGALSGLGVFNSIQHLVNSLTSSQNSTGVNAKAWFSASRVLGYTALLGSLNIVLITAMSTIGSVVYNLTSRLVGGVEVTLRETE